MQTIIGAGGTIGKDLAKFLREYTESVKLVSRKPVKINDTDLLQAADVSDPAQIYSAIEGSEICYVAIGFDYNLKVWREKWPSFMSHVITACIRNQCKLVFFDNIYAIGKDHVGHITESSPISPCSKKGTVRAAVDRMILEQVEKGKLQAIIARAPDFFGPHNKQTSVMMNTVYDNLAKGKTAQWFSNADVVHSMGFTPDLARGFAILGNTADAYNQVWNLPVNEHALTGRQWIKLFAKEMNASDKVQIVPVWMIKILGLFVPVLREMPEMMYQFDRPYFFDSSKFLNRFNFIPVTNEEAVRQTVAAFSQQP